VDNDMMGALAEDLMFIYVIDKVTGKRKRVYVKDDATKRRLLAKNRELKKKLAARSKIKRKKTKR
jgi:hypothetical protein